LTDSEIKVMLCEKCGRAFHYHAEQVKVKCPHCAWVQTAKDVVTQT
jgi:predicted RNA-binding Zn-ribbon protein involved in translation (DUF1610 family)